MEVRFDHEKLRKRDTALYRRLLHDVATLFIKGSTHKEIAQSIHEWARKNASGYYNEKGTDNINTVWVGRRIADARDHDFLLLGRIEERELAKTICSSLPSAERINIVVAPDYDALLRQVWLDIDEILTEKVKYSKGTEDIIVAVSGGATMLALTKTAPRVKDLLKWHKPGEITQARKDKVTIFSLTSGGRRTDIAALSDTVAANIAQELGVKVRGLMGPALFHNKPARDALVKDPEVHQHIEYVKKADIILTSVGYVNTKDSLTKKFLQSIDKQCIDSLLKKNPNLSDILTNCYDGFSGEPIPFSSKIKNRIFSVITCQELRRMVNRGHTRCVAVAQGYQKGYHALRGVIVKRMASDIYMDVECAKGLIEVANEFE